MKILEGIVKLRGKTVVLEDIENPRLRKALNNRLMGNISSFCKKIYNKIKYQEYGEHRDSFYNEKIDEEPSKDPSNHTDKIEYRPIINFYYMDNMNTSK